MTESLDHRCYNQLFIGGHWRTPSTEQRLTVISPHSEKPIGDVPAAAPADVDAAVAAIVPWKVPQFLIMPKLIPALIAGCPVIVKPAPETPLDALWLAEMIEQLDLPDGVVSVLPGGTDVGEALVRHPGVDKVSFTGSSAVGRRIAALCGEQLKRVSLELGGKSAAIILHDADRSEERRGGKEGRYRWAR